jgi:cytochrome subunit of sulfide dehydrogenase
MKASGLVRLVAMTIVVSLTVQAASASSEPPPGAASCSGCHPARAAGAPAVPSLYGRDAGEIVTAMMAFRAGTRQSTIMGRIAKGFSNDELHSIAAWLAAQKQGM